MINDLFTRKLALLLGILLTANTAVRAEQNQNLISHLSQGEKVGEKVEAKSYPWSAIGKLNNGVGGSCTAVLISQKYALTAAHCLFFRNTGHYLPAQSLHLVLGYENQEFKDHLRIAAYHVASAYQPLRPYETLASDWALLSVSNEQHSKIQPLKIASNREEAETHLMTAGYSHLTPYAMTADRTCRNVGRSHDGGLIYDSCKAPAGYSGSPVLVPNAGRDSYFVTGIHVANQFSETDTIAIAIPIETIWHEIKSCVKNNECQFQIVAQGRDPTAAELLSNLPNLGYSIHSHPSADSTCNNGNPGCKTYLIGP